MSLQLLLIPTVALLLGADDAQTDAAKLQGTWSVVVAERAGEKLDDQEMKQLKVMVKDHTIAFTREGETKREEAGFKLDPSTKPKSIDLTSPKQKARLGIYALEGDTLRVCWSKKDGDRPAEFATKAGSRHILFVLKREKKE